MNRFLREFLPLLNLLRIHYHSYNPYKFLRQLGERYTQEIEQSKQQVFAACGTTFNLNSTQQLGDVLFDKLQLPHGKKTARGYSTSAEVLEGLHSK